MKKVIFGAGKYGKHVLKILLESNNEVIAFVDNNKNIVGTNVEGVKVISMDELTLVKNEVEIIVAITDFHTPVLQMIVNEIHDFEICDPKLGFVKIKGAYKKGYSKFVQIRIQDNYIINCPKCESGCNNGVDSRYVSEGEFQSVILGLKKIFYHIERMDLFGEESILIPEVGNIIKIAKKHFPNTVIEINSNELLVLELNKSDNLVPYWKSCNETMNSNKSEWMQRYRLNNGYEIPRIGYGSFPYKKVLEQTVPIAAENMYELVDTSDNYLNEEFVGKGLANINNKKMVVISKFSYPLRTYELEKCFEESKEKLGGQLNIYLLHWPYPFLWKRQWKKMEDLYLAGCCDAIGVCNFEKKHLKKLFKICRVKPAINQFERHPIFQQNEIVKFCQENGIQVMSYSPVARMDKRLVENHTLKEIAQKYNKSICQIIMRWNIEHKCIPIPASQSVSHIFDNINIFDFELTSEEVEQIDNLEAGLRVRFDPNKRFSRKEKLEFLKLFLTNELYKN